MADICGFSAKVHGSNEQLQEVADWVNSRCSAKGYIVNEASWAWLHDGIRLDPGDSLVNVHGRSNVYPGLFIAEMIAERFPTLRVVHGGDDDEGNVEGWEYHNGTSRLIEFASIIWFNTFGVHDYEVQDGFRLTQEERVEAIYERIVQFDKVNGKSPGEWKNDIRMQLYNRLPTVFRDWFIQSLPSRKQGKRNEQASTSQ